MVTQNKKGSPESKKDRFSRRDFLRTSAAALAGTALTSQLAFANTAPKKIRIGVVGGGFGRGFQWHEHPDCIVEAVSDLEEERRKILTRIYGCQKTYNSLEELVLDKNIDAVGVFTDGPLHVQHVEEAMKHGKHVISAVPACWGTMEQAYRLADIVKKYGLYYMMAETSYYRSQAISARKFLKEGKFGEIFYCEAEYQHSGLEKLYFRNGKRTWRYGMAPMHYPTHCTGYLVGLTGERLVEVCSHGWGNDDQILKDNPYKNPFWNESAMFKTNRGHAFRAYVWWKGAHTGCERAEWIGDKMSFYYREQGLPELQVFLTEKETKDDAGYAMTATKRVEYDQPLWWKSDMLPEPLRHNSGHGGSHPFLTHEFIEALTHDRQPVIDIKEALAYTVPGIIAHESSLAGGELKKIPQFDSYFNF